MASAAHDPVAYPKTGSQIDDAIACEHERGRSVGDTRREDRQQ